MRLVAFFLVVIVLLSSTALVAQDTDANHPSLRKYLSAETVFVSWLDISKLDVSKVATFLEEVGIRSTNAEELKRITAIKEALEKLGTQKIYLLNTLASLPNGPVQYVMPSGNPAAAVLLLNSTQSANSHFQFQEDGDVVLGGTPESIAQLIEHAQKPTPQLLAAIDACKSDHGVAFATPTYVTMSMMEILKSSLEKDDIGTVATAAETFVNMKWASLSGDLPPNEIDFEIRMKSSDSAKDLAGFATQMLKERISGNAQHLALAAEDASVKFVSRSADDSLAAVHALRKLLTGPNGNPRTNNSIKQIALALLNYNAAYQHFPPQSLVDEEGERLLSWRVLILPFLDQTKRFNQFHLDEPWDSPHNLKLAKTIPDVYRSLVPVVAKDPSGAFRTRILAPLTQQSAFGRPGKPITYRDIIDGTSNTISFVEAAPEYAVVWTKPDDLTIDLGDPVGSILGSSTAKGFLASRIDGSAGFFSKENTVETINALLTINGGEVIDREDLK